VSEASENPMKNWIPTTTTLRSFGLLMVLAVGLLGPLAPAPQPDCCCGDVCFMACARDREGADRHLSESEGYPEARVVAASRCGAASPGISSFSSERTLFGSAVTVADCIPSATSMELSEESWIPVRNPGFSPFSPRPPPPAFLFS
jgi:hypothetical protein